MEPHSKGMTGGLLVRLPSLRHDRQYAKGILFHASECPPHCTVSLRVKREQQCCRSQGEAARGAVMRPVAVPEPPNGSDR